MVPFFAAVLAAAILKSVTDRSSPGGSSQEMIGEGGIQPGGGTGHHCKSFRRFRQVFGRRRLPERSLNVRVLEKSN